MNNSLLKWKTTLATLSKTCTAYLMTSIQGTLRLQLRIKTNIFETAPLWAMFSQQRGDNLVTTSERRKERERNSQQQNEVSANTVL